MRRALAVPLAGLLLSFLVQQASAGMIIYDAAVPLFSARAELPGLVGTASPYDVFGTSLSPSSLDAILFDVFNPTVTPDAFLGINSFQSATAPPAPCFLDLVGTADYIWRQR